MTLNQYIIIQNPMKKKIKINPTKRSISKEMGIDYTKVGGVTAVVQSRQNIVQDLWQQGFGNKEILEFLNTPGESGIKGDWNQDEINNTIRYLEENRLVKPSGIRKYSDGGIHKNPAEPKILGPEIASVSGELPWKPNQIRDNTPESYLAKGYTYMNPSNPTTAGGAMYYPGQNRGTPGASSFTPKYDPISFSASKPTPGVGHQLYGTDFKMKKTVKHGTWENYVDNFADPASQTKLRKHYNMQPPIAQPVATYKNGGKIKHGHFLNKVIKMHAKHLKHPESATKESQLEMMDFLKKHKAEIPKFQTGGYNWGNPAANAQGIQGTDMISTAGGADDYRNSLDYIDPFLALEEKGKKEGWYVEGMDVAELVHASKGGNPAGKLANTTTPNAAGLIAPIAGVAAGAVEAFVPTNQETGEGLVGKGIATGALKGAATGASIGSIIPGWGTAAGAIIGGVVGGIGGGMKGQKAKDVIEDQNVIEAAEQQKVVQEHHKVWQEENPFFKLGGSTDHNLIEVEGNKGTKYEKGEFLVDENTGEILADYSGFKTHENGGLVIPAKPGVVIKMRGGDSEKYYNAPKDTQMGMIEGHLFAQENRERKDLVTNEVAVETLKNGGKVNFKSKSAYDKWASYGENSGLFNAKETKGASIRGKKVLIPKMDTGGGTKSKRVNKENYPDFQKDQFHS